jgi:DNA invertase Pin-like site-specific DNA recombinase
MKKPKKTPPLPTGTAYGYARVSTDGQSVEAQVRQLTKAGCKKVFREVASGAKTGGAQLRRLLGQLEAGDVLTVTRLDRLARSTRDLLSTIADRKFRSLGDTWADTTTSHGRLMLTVLGGLAEFERDLIRARTSEGRERAKARGMKLGRPHKLTPRQRQQILRRKENGEAVRKLSAATTFARRYAWTPSHQNGGRHQIRTGGRLKFGMPGRHRWNPQNRQPAHSYSYRLVRPPQALPSPSH